MGWKKYSSLILLGLIILLAIGTRLYKLGEAPAGLYVDEAGQGYSAYSILKTGKDEFGKSFPIVFRSLTDFKTPIYIYLVVPLIPVFGLTPFTVRFPSFIFSILTVPILFFLIRELKNNNSLEIKNCKLEIIASLLLAISPWHILFGRTNFECNVALFFFLSGILGFYKGLKNPKILLLSALMFAIAIPAYHSQRIITPLTMIILFIKYRSVLLDKVHRTYLAFGVLIGLTITLPTLSIITTPGFLARASGLNIFTNPVAGHGRLYAIPEFIWLYFSYLSPRYMFFLGDYGVRSSFPELSTFFLWQFPFYIYGLWILFKDKNLGELKFIVLLILLLGPIPAAITRDPYTTIRALPLVIPQIIIISLAVVKLLRNRYTTFILLLLCFYSVFKLYSSVIILNEYYRAKAWDWGWREVTAVIKNQNLPVVIDNARIEPDLQIAFFLKYDPTKYQAENFEVPLNEYFTNLKREREKHIGNITTRPIVWQEDLLKDQIMVGDELSISTDQIKEHHLTLISEIDYPDGTVAYRIVKTNPTWEKLQKIDKTQAPRKGTQSS